MALFPDRFDVVVEGAPPPAPLTGAQIAAVTVALARDVLHLELRAEQVAFAVAGLLGRDVLFGSPCGSGKTAA